jgi:phosphate/sulfate permease
MLPPFQLAMMNPTSEASERNERRVKGKRKKGPDKKTRKQSRYQTLSDDGDDEEVEIEFGGSSGGDRIEAEEDEIGIDLGGIDLGGDDSRVAAAGRTAVAPPPEPMEANEVAKLAFRELLVVMAAMASFVHGANDTANATGDIAA